MKSQYTAVLSVTALLSTTALGCSHPWNQYHSALETLAQTTTTVNDGLADVATVESDAAIDATAEEARQAAEVYRVCMSENRPDCGTEPTLDSFMARYRERVSAWHDVQVAFDEIRAALLLGEDAAEIWRERQEMPNEVGDICRQIEQAYEHLTTLLAPLIQSDRANEVMSSLQIVIRPVCNLIAGEVTNDE